MALDFKDLNNPFAGQSLQELLAQIQEEQRQRNIALIQSAPTGPGKAGASLGVLLSRLFGGYDPSRDPRVAIKKQTDDDVAGVNLEDPVSLRQRARVLQQTGEPERQKLASILEQKATALERESVKGDIDVQQLEGLTKANQAAAIKADEEEKARFIQGLIGQAGADNIPSLRALAATLRKSNDLDDRRASVVVLDRVKALEKTNSEIASARSRAKAAGKETFSDVKQDADGNWIGLSSDGTVKQLPKQEQVGLTAARTEKMAAQEDVLRKELNGLAELNISTLEEVVKQMAVFSDLEGSGARDLAGLFTFMRGLDPGSVVREGEQDRALAAQGIFDRIRALDDRVEAGELFSENMRADILELTSDLAQVAFDLVGKKNARYDTIVQDRKLNRDNVLIPTAGIAQRIEDARTLAAKIRGKGPNEPRDKSTTETIKHELELDDNGLPVIR